jgi:hypothetical protein
MEYSCFDFRSFTELQKAFALYWDFVHFVDDEFDFASFADLL